jgi:hypothetical protein
MDIDRRHLARYGGIGLVAVVTGGGGGLGSMAARRRRRQRVDSAIEEVRRLPLIGPVMGRQSGRREPHARRHRGGDAQPHA